MKKRIKCNTWGNWYGYIGTRRVKAFANTTEQTAKQAAEQWLQQDNSKADAGAAIREFNLLCLEEEARVHRVLKLYTLEGIMKAIEIWEAHFKQKYTHGISTKRDIARVNVMRRQNGGEPLC